MLLFGSFYSISIGKNSNSRLIKNLILRSMSTINENTYIPQLFCCFLFLKIKSKGFVPKKLKVYKEDQVLTSMKNFFGEINLLYKVVLVIRVFGGLRRHELVEITIDDIQDNGFVLLVKILKI